MQSSSLESSGTVSSLPSLRLPHAMATALSAVFFAPALARPRRARAACVASAAKPDAKKQQGWVEKATVSGGGFSGACDIEVRAWNDRAASCRGAARRAGRHRTAVGQ